MASHKIAVALLLLVAASGAMAVVVKAPAKLTKYAGTFPLVLKAVDNSTYFGINWADASFSFISSADPAPGELDFPLALKRMEAKGSALAFSPTVKIATVHFSLFLIFEGSNYKNIMTMDCASRIAVATQKVKNGACAVTGATGALFGTSGFLSFGAEYVSDTWHFLDTKYSLYVPVSQDDTACGKSSDGC